MTNADRLPEPDQRVELSFPDDGVPAFDFRGHLCPINFVKTRIELEKVHPGECIRVAIDKGEPMLNVPRSVKLEGHEVVEDIANDDESHTLTIRRANT